MERGRGMLNVIHPESGLKADLFFSEPGELYEWAFAQRKIIRLNEYPYFFAPAEFVILKKLEYFQEGNGEKHIRDIEGIMFVHGKHVDHQFLQRSIRSRGLAEAWAKVNQTPPAPPTASHDPRN